MAKIRFIVTPVEGAKNFGLSYNDSALLYYIYLNSPSGYCTSTKEDIATTLGISEKTIYRSIGKCTQKKLLIKRVSDGALKVSQLYLSNLVYDIIEIKKRSKRPSNSDSTVKKTEAIQGADGQKDRTNQGETVKLTVIHEAINRLKNENKAVFEQFLTDPFTSHPPKIDYIYNILSLIVSNNIYSSHKDIDIRKFVFAIRVLGYHRKYPANLLLDFFSHWSEHNENGRKMEFERKKTWNLSQRLATWKRNDRFGKYDPPKKSKYPVTTKEAINPELEKYKQQHRPLTFAQLQGFEPLDDGRWYDQESNKIVNDKPVIK